MPHVDTPQGSCLAGAARADITPPVGIYHRMWGAATQDRATGVHRPLTATALVLRGLEEGPGVNEQVLVAVDLCLLGAREMGALREAICSANGLAPEQLLVAFSHTHAAGLLGLDRVDLPGGDLIPPYLDSLARNVADAVARARAALRPAVVTYGTGRCTLAAHRDFWDAERGQYVCGLNPAGEADDTVLVARITDEGGAPLATVVNYACHPTTLAWENTLISPDFPGALREAIEGATGVPCLFFQGTSGDLGPREGFVGDPAVADKNGRQLGHAALATLEGLPPPGTRFVYTGPVISGATVGTWAHEPLDETGRARLARWDHRHGTVPLPYRPDLRTLQQTEEERARLMAEEAEARRAGDEAGARERRALVERLTRWLGRLRQLPGGGEFPLPFTLWRMGDGVWLGVEGEHYQWLQRTLRRHFPDRPLFVITLANGSRPTYLLTRDAHGKGIYQESVAVLAAGSLERLAEVLVEEIGALSDDGKR
jgi:hypothetical protein